MIIAINFLYIVVPSSMTKIGVNAQWKQNGIMIAAGNGKGDGLNQLKTPWGLYVDNEHQTIYIADSGNHRILEWKYGATSGLVVAGGNGQGNQSNQLRNPRHVIVDKETDSLIISDTENSRVMQWPLRKGAISGKIIISDICCHGLAIDNDGYLYVPDFTKHEVRRWKIGESVGTLVAGGNGAGNRLNQLNGPMHVFVDEDHSVYVSDQNNHRVMKWERGANEGIVVAGGQGLGNSLSQLSDPRGVIVDRLGAVYVADTGNHLIMRWCKDAKQGNIVVGGNGQGGQPNQFYYPIDLSFDRQGNLYVVDMGNCRIQRFDID
jgi:sugar lactone lactonase YvrE